MKKRTNNNTYNTPTQYWNKHKSKILHMAKERNDGDWQMVGNERFTKIAKELFTSQVKALMDDDPKLTVEMAALKELRSYDFTTKAHFYAQGVLDKIMENHSEELGNMDSRGRFRNSKGQYRTDPVYSIEYMGSVMIQDNIWSQYSFIAKDGKRKYFYETGSPKTSSYSTMVSEERLGAKL